MTVLSIQRNIVYVHKSGINLKMYEQINIRNVFTNVYYNKHFSSNRFRYIKIRYKMFSSCKKTSHVRIRSIPRLLTVRSSFVGRAFNGCPLQYAEWNSVTKSFAGKFPLIQLYLSSLPRACSIFFPWRFIPIMHCQNPHLHSRALCNESLRFLTYALDSIAFSRTGCTYVV